MAVTYYLTSTNSDLTGGSNWSEALSQSTSAQSDLTISISVGATETDYGYSPSGEPGSAGTTGTFTIKVNIITGDTNVQASVAVARVNSSGVQQAISSFTAEQTASAGIKTFTVSSPALGTWASGDRLRIHYRWRSTASMGSPQSITIRLNTTDASAAMPWGAAQALAASVAGTSTPSAPLLKANRPLASSVSGVASLAAPLLKRSFALTPSVVSGAGGVTSDLTVATVAGRGIVGWAVLIVPPRNTGGAVSLAAAVDGAAVVTPPLLSRWRPISGASAGAAAVTVPLLYRSFRLGTVTATGSSALSAPSLRASLALSAAVAGSATPATPLLALLRAIAGSAAGAGSVTGAARVSWALGGSTSGAASLSAPLLKRSFRLLPTGVSGAASVSGLGRVSWALGGSTSGAASLSTPLLKRSFRLLPASVSGAASVSGTVGRLQRMAATVTALSTASASTIVTILFLGTAASAGVATGSALRPTSQRGLSGIANGLATPTGTPTFSWALRGSSHGSTVVRRGAAKNYPGTLNPLWSSGMSIEQLGSSIKFVAFFTSNGLGLAGLGDVTVDVYNPAGSIVVSNGVATALGGGLYTYVLNGAQASSEGEYAAIFKTSSMSADFRHIPHLWSVGRAGLECLDASINSRLPTSSYAAAPSANAVRDAILGQTDLASYADGSVADQLEAIKNRNGLYFISPLVTDGYVELQQGDDYTVALGRQIDFSDVRASWPDLTGATVTLTAISSNRNPSRLSVTGSVVNAGTASQKARFEVLSAQTASLATGQEIYDYQVKATVGGSDVTLSRGKLTLLKDLTAS